MAIACPGDTYNDVEGQTNQGACQPCPNPNRPSPSPSRSRSRSRSPSPNPYSNSRRVPTVPRLLYVGAGLGQQVRVRARVRVGVSEPRSPVLQEFRKSTVDAPPVAA